jgi:hypothetical protein
MLTALVHAGSTPGALAATLSSLVPAVAAGLMSHAVVAMRQGDAEAERIADALGAAAAFFTASPWVDAAGLARGSWALLLEAGEEPGDGWISCVERHFMRHADSGRAALLPLGGVAGVAERAAMLANPRGLRAGLLAPRAEILSGLRGKPPLRLSAIRRR